MPEMLRPGNAGRRRPSSRGHAPAAAARVLVALVMAGVWGVALPTPASSSTVTRASFDLQRGTAAGLKLGQSSRRDATRRFGEPKEITPDQNTGTTRLVWACGRGCTFEVRVRGVVVVTVWAYGRVTRPRIRTRAGSSLGMPEGQAAAREGGRFVDSCTRELGKSRGGLSLSLSSSGGKIDSILMHTRKGRVLC